MLRRTNPNIPRRLTGLSVAVTASFAMVSCGESDVPAGDQAAAAELYIEISSASNPDCVRSEHGKVDNEKEDVAYAAIGEEKMTESTAALDKCSMG